MLRKWNGTFPLYSITVCLLVPVTAPVCLLQGCVLKRLCEGIGISGEKQSGYHTKGTFCGQKAAKRDCQISGVLPADVRV